MRFIKTGMLWHIEKWRKNKLIESFTGHNIMTTEGLSHLCGASFVKENQVSEWRISIFENNFTEAAGATYATPGSMTECTAISQVARPIYDSTQTNVAVSSENNKASFDFTAAKTIYGIALVGFNGTESTGSITAFADYSGTVSGTVLVTSAGHGRSTDDVLVISDTTNYNGTFKITTVDINTFYITATWVSDDATGTWKHKPVAKLGDTAGGGIMLDVYNFGTGNEKSMEIGETLKIWGTFTFADA